MKSTEAVPRVTLKGLFQWPRRAETKLRPGTPEPDIVAALMRCYMELTRGE